MHEYTKQIFDENGELVSSTIDMLPKQSQVDELYRNIVDKYTNANCRILAKHRMGWSFTFVALLEQGDQTRTWIHTCKNL